MLSSQSGTARVSTDAHLATGAEPDHSDVHVLLVACIGSQTPDHNERYAGPGLRRTCPAGVAPAGQRRSSPALLGYRWGMSLPLEDVPFTEFIQRPTAATGRLATVRALRLRRRDADDLVVMSAVRADREREVIELTARLLSSLVHHAKGPALFEELLPEVLPWTRFLPAADLQNMIQEFIEVTKAAASVDNVAPIAQLLVEWRHTAEVHADPELHALLSTPRGEDHGPALPPDPQDGE